MKTMEGAIPSPCSLLLKLTMNEISHLCKFGVNHSVIIAGLCTKGKSDNINDDMNMVQQLVQFDFAPS
jgi:hypothetical protein